MVVLKRLINFLLAFYESWCKALSDWGALCVPSHCACHQVSKK